MHRLATTRKLRMLKTSSISFMQARGNWLSPASVRLWVPAWQSSFPRELIIVSRISHPVFLPGWFFGDRQAANKRPNARSFQSMEISLTFASIAALSGVLLIGAAIPSVSVLAVSARSAALGWVHGVFTSLGIVVGDVVFIVLAIYGLSVLAGWLDSRFFLVQYLGGAYLLWLGIMLWRSSPKTGAVEMQSESSLLSSFMTGLLITLGDQKAVLFYLGFFPAFLDLSRLSWLDTGIIIVIALIAVGGPKLVYAYLAHRAGAIFKNNRVANALNKVVGSVMIALGGFVILRTS